jgi:hypothetical protein
LEALNQQQRATFFRSEKVWAEVGSRYFLRQASNLGGSNPMYDFAEGGVVVQAGHYRYRMIGNAVQILVAEYLAAEVVF